MQDDVLSLEAFVPYRLNRLADAVSRDFARIYKDRHGLTRPEWRLLATLGQYGTMTATEIAQHSAMHKTKVSRAVSALARRGWLLRREDDADRRIEHLALTRAGQKAYGDLVPFAKEFEAQLLGGLQGEDRRRALEGLAALERLALARGR